MERQKRSDTAVHQNAALQDRITLVHVHSKNGRRSFQTVVLQNGWYLRKMNRRFHTVVEQDWWYLVWVVHLQKNMDRFFLSSHRMVVPRVSGSSTQKYGQMFSVVSQDGCTSCEWFVYTEIWTDVFCRLTWWFYLVWVVRLHRNMDRCFQTVLLHGGLSLNCVRLYSLLLGTVLWARSTTKKYVREGNKRQSISYLFLTSHETLFFVGFFFFPN